MDDGKTLASETVASLARDPLRRADAAGGKCWTWRCAGSRGDERMMARRKVRRGDGED